MTQSEALDILKTGANVFLTGEPGSGKTHTVNAYVAYLRERGIEPAITASTGIAATHIGGMTIHSWSGIGIKKRLSAYDLDRIGSNEYLVKRIARAKVLIIDEVSMLSPETLDAVDAVCRSLKESREPFGGLQIVLVGDFFQLPPIVKREVLEEDGEQVLFADAESECPRFAYHSSAWERSQFLVCYLTEQHRQDDADYLELLSALRANAFTGKHRAHLEKRRVGTKVLPEGAPKLYSHNADVDRMNEEMLRRLSAKENVFMMTAQGPDWIVANMKKSCLSPERLALKKGASVMFTKNNPRLGYVNGTLGKVEGFAAGSPMVRTHDKRMIIVEPMEWAIEENGKIRARINQLPLRLAWAITVHKSQGMSLDEAVMDLSQVFEYGQGYVALSRVRRLSGLHLLGWNERCFEVHPDILTRDQHFRRDSKDAELSFSAMERERLSLMHANFVKACGGTVSKGKKEPKKSTIEETCVFVKQGLSVDQISKKRKLATSTILEHLEKLVKMRKIDPQKDLAHLREPPARFDKMIATFEKRYKATTEVLLAPIQQILGPSYSYDELRLARLFVNRPLP